MYFTNFVPSFAIYYLFWISANFILNYIKLKSIVPSLSKALVHSANISWRFFVSAACKVLPDVEPHTHTHTFALYKRARYQSFKFLKTFFLYLFVQVLYLFARLQQWFLSAVLQILVILQFGVVWSNLSFSVNRKCVSIKKILWSSVHIHSPMYVSISLYFCSLIFFYTFICFIFCYLYCTYITHTLSLSVRATEDEPTSPFLLLFLSRYFTIDKHGRSRYLPLLVVCAPKAILGSLINRPMPPINSQLD